MMRGGWDEVYRGKIKMRQLANRIHF